MTTPTRTTGGIRIDTKSTSRSCHGLYTPPSSAHESRRPSFSYNSLSEVPYSANASTYAYSQPTTPVHNLNSNTEAFDRSLSRAIEPQACLSTNWQATSHCDSTPEQGLHAMFQHHAVSEPSAAHGLSTYTSCAEPHMGLFDLQTHTVLNTANDYGTQPTATGTGLFPACPGLSHETVSPVSMYDDGFASFHPPQQDFESSTFASLNAYDSQTTAVLQHPQVIVPSQLSPHDDSMHPYINGYASPMQTHVGSTSFASSAASFGEFELMNAPSPLEEYFDQSEEDGYLDVKMEASDLPMGSSAARRHRKSNGTSRRRSSQRFQNSSKRGECWYRHDAGSIEIRCEGKPFKLPTNPHQPVIKVDVARKHKLHPCTFMKPDGTLCGCSFDRSEHLKRHMGSHNPDRKYMCPIQGCKSAQKGGIQRPDNAGDHFKTHLRGAKKGKRNDHIGWPELHNLIVQTYDDKKVAKKLLDNLRRWVDLGMPSTPGQRRSDAMIDAASVTAVARSIC